MIDNLMGNQTKAVGIEFQPIAPVSLREMVLSALREAILRGTLQPGQRLTETLISKQMQVAQNVVREALQELAIRSWIRVTYRSQLPQILHNYSGACLVHGFPFA